MAGLAPAAAKTLSLIFALGVEQLMAKLNISARLNIKLNTEQLVFLEGILSLLLSHG